MSTTPVQTIPQRSVLLNQTPIGLGTPFVESMESYTCRLARRHGVARFTLEQLVIGRGPKLYMDRQGSPRLDAPTEAAAAFASRLAVLTGCKEVRALGLGRFAGTLPNAHALRRHRAWCGKCFHDARASGQEAHLQLLWTLAGFERCVIHGDVLQTQCSCCGRKCAPSRSWHRDLDQCPWCGKDLADGRTGAALSFAQIARRGEAETDHFLGTILGAFIARASVSMGSVGAADLRGLVDRALAKGHVRHMCHLAVSAGVPPSTMTGLIKKRSRPSLQILVRLAGAARVTLASVLLGDEPGEEGPMPPAGLQRLPRLKTSRRHIWTEVELETNKVVASGEAVSLTEMGRRVGVDYAYLACRIAPEVRQTIADRGRAARVQARRARLMTLAEQIRRAIAQLSADGVRVSARAVSELLNLPVGSMYFRIAYHKMVRADG